jgi:hypothetical protein
MRGSYKTPIRRQIRAFAVGLGFAANRLWPIGYVDLRRTQANVKIVEFCNCLLRLILLGLLFFASLQAKVIDIQSFKEVSSYLTKETLLILDIDDTLLIPEQMLGCDEWFTFRLKRRQNEMASSEALEKTLSEWEAIRHLTNMEIVEPGSDKIVQGLQKQGHCVMGLTTQGLALATRTSQQLKACHFDLSSTAPSKEDCFFTLNSHGVLYRNGILFTSGMPKGKALFQLCEKIGYKPQRIVFVNDKATHIADLEATAKEKGIECLGLRYAYSDAKKAAFSPEIAEFQFTHSSFDRIMSDEEALTKCKAALH